MIDRLFKLIVASHCFAYDSTAFLLWDTMHVAGWVWHLKSMAEAVTIKEKITLYLQEAVTALQQETIDKDEPIGR